MFSAWYKRLLGRKSVIRIIDVAGKVSAFVCSVISYAPYIIIHGKGFLIIILDFIVFFICILCQGRFSGLIVNRKVILFLFSK